MCHLHFWDGEIGRCCATCGYFGSLIDAVALEIVASGD